MSPLMTTTDIVEVITTGPDQEWAATLITSLLRGKLVACGQQIAIRSRYRWQGRFEDAAEVRVVLHTTAALAGVVREAILADHPYDLPAILVTWVMQCNERYAEWVREETRS
jgi:periplasmic divalent cation tolerance protein